MSFYLEQLREAAEKYTNHDASTHGVWPRLVWRRRVSVCRMLLSESEALIPRIHVFIPELPTTLRKKDVELLISTRELLDEILETVEVPSDPRTSKALKEGLRDMKNCRVRPYRDFERAP